MKYVYVLLVALVCMTGCSFRDGASTTAAGLSSVMWSVVGVPGTYGEDKDYWNEKFKVKPKSEPTVLKETSEN